jgi:pimeloyl-ACP methyl ester carboxylesterase
MRLAAAITNDFTTLSGQRWAVPAADIDDYLDPMDIVDPAVNAEENGANVEHAVMVVHGIRDNGFWTKRVAREVKSLGRMSHMIVRAPTPTYGYFSMWDFVKPGGREQATFWFMERYADVRSHFPDAKVSFVGHSNGTYIAARALELCSAIRFENIVFAGSVVRRDFRWARFPGRVRRILNYVGSSDGVVAFLPAVFEFLRLRWLDVGGAGAFGFKEAEPRSDSPKRLLGTPGEYIELTEVRFVQGGHSAAITEHFWPEIARFVLFSEPPVQRSVGRADEIRLLFRCAPAITLVGIAIALALWTSPVSVAVVAAGLVASHAVDSAWGTMGTFFGVLASLGVSWLTGRFLRLW